MTDHDEELTLSPEEIQEGHVALCHELYLRQCANPMATEQELLFALEEWAALYLTPSVSRMVN